MLSKTDQLVEDWVREVVGGAELSFQAPGSESATGSIGAYLYEVRQADKRAGGARRFPIKLELRYLITTWSQQPKEAHRVLGELLISAIESPDFDVDPVPPAPVFWNSFQCSPRPCFVLCVSAYHEFTDEVAPRVKAAPAVRATMVGELQGSVIGPGGVPLSGASVDIPEYSLATTSDVNGHFYFASVPTDPVPSVIVVTYKGVEHRFDTRVRTESDQPIVIEIPL